MKTHKYTQEINLMESTRFAAGSGQYSCSIDRIYTRINAGLNTLRMLCDKIPVQGYYLLFNDYSMIPFCLSFMKVFF